MSNTKYTIRQVEDMESHAELIGGELVVQPFTSPTHNLVIGEISLCLWNYFHTHNLNHHIFCENVALYINELLEDDNEFYLPDIMVIGDSSGIDENGVHTAPIFVAEVTSEESKKYDYNKKLETYRKIGVAEYWIVDLQRKIVCKYLASEDYIPQTFFSPKEIDISVFPNISIDLSEFM